VHYKFIAFNCCKVTTIPPFGVLIKKIKISTFRLLLIKRQQDEEEMRFQKQNQIYKTKSPTLQPVLPLVKEQLPAADNDKAKFIAFSLKVCAGTEGPSYRKFMRLFDEGSPQEWMDVLTGLNEIWTQNSVNEPTDRAATISAILKGDSRTAFDTAMEDARINPVEEEENPVLDMTLEHIEESLRAVTDIVFPFRALEVQKQWMTRYMRKPYDLSTKKMAAALSRINNHLPFFPNGTAASKFSEAEIVGLLEFSLPNSWRNAMDLKGFVPSDNDKKALVDECERIERNETPIVKEKEHHDNNNKNNKKVNFAKSQNDNKKNGSETIRTTDGFYCKKCGSNPTHNTDKCFVLKRLAREAEQAGSNSGEGKAHAKPYSKRTFRKEVNALARRAGKHNGLGLLSTAVKREKIKSEKRDKKAVKKAKSKPEPMSDDTGSDTDGSIHNLEAKIPRKNNKNVRYNSRAEVVDIEDSSDEDEDNNATQEEAAFLRAISKEEKKQHNKGTRSKMDEDSD
jgi:hypothetical protein